MQCRTMAHKSANAMYPQQIARCVWDPVVGPDGRFWISLYVACEAPGARHLQSMMDSWQA